MDYRQILDEARKALSHDRKKALQYWQKMDKGPRRDRFKYAKGNFLSKLGAALDALESILEHAPGAAGESYSPPYITRDKREKEDRRSASIAQARAKWFDHY